MQVKVEKTSPVSAKLKIRMPADRVNERLQDYFARLAKKAKIPGFRPGKAPTDVVKKMYAEDSASDLSERLISEGVFEAVRGQNLQIVTPPQLIATDSPAENKDFNFEVEVDLKPQVPTIKLKGLVVEAPAAKTVTEQDIDDQIKHLLDGDASYVDVKEARPVKNGDCVVMSFDGSVDGKSEPGMKSESHTLVLGEGNFLPDFEAALIGMNLGDEKTADVGFPSDYHAEHLQGKTAQFKIKINGHKEKVLPKLDDEFVKSIDPDVKSVAEFREKVRAKMSESKERLQKDELKERMGDVLVEKFQFDVSPRQIEMVAHRLAHQTHQMMHQMGHKHDETDELHDNLLKSSMKKAERDVRLSYILEAIALEQKFEVTEADIEAKLEAIAKRANASVAQVKAYYSQKEQDSEVTRIDRLKVDLLDEKSLDYALSQATIKDKG